MKLRRPFIWGVLLPAGMAALGIFYYFYGKDVSNYLDERGVDRSIHAQSVDAIAYYSWAILLDPSNADAYFHRGEERLKFPTNDLASGSADYDRAVEVSRGGIANFMRSQRAKFRVSKGDYNGAIEDLDLNAKDTIGSGPDDLCWRGMAHQALNKPELAIQDFTASISNFPTAEAYEGRADVEYLNGDAAAAVTDLHSAAKLAPEKFYPHLDLWLFDSEDPARRPQAVQEFTEYMHDHASAVSSDQIILAQLIVGKISLRDFSKMADAEDYPDYYLYAAAKSYFEGDIATARICIQKCRNPSEKAFVFSRMLEFWQRRLASSK